MPELIDLGPCTIDLDGRRVTWPDRIERLSALEADLIRVLVSAGGRPVGRDLLLRDVWGYADGVQTRAVDFAIRRLRRKLEVDPADAVVLQSVRGEGYRLALGAAPPAPAPAPAPAVPARLFGRAGELRAVQDLFDGGARLVTLAGPGGVGKTTLATAYLEGAALRGRFVDLCVAEGADQVAFAVARALGAPANRELAEEGAVLLVLDNAEHVIEAVARLVSGWLGTAPEARFLVTSREPLELGPERVLRLQGLSGADAVDLFERRALAVDAAWAPSDAERAALHDLIRTLGGLPLAVELAAARTPLLTPSQILARLEQGAGVLRDRRRDRPSRHASLTRAIQWSWDLLDDDERRVLAEAAAFPGAFSAEAAEAVIAVPDALDRLEDLLHRSLVRREGARLRLDFGVRAFAREAMPEAVRGASERHADWVLGVAAELATVRALEPFVDDLVAVARAAPDVQAGRAVLALRPVLFSHGPGGALVPLLDAAAARPIPAELKVQVLSAIAEVRAIGSRFDEAVAAVEEARVHAAGDRPALARLAGLEAIVLQYAGRRDESLVSYDTAVDLMRTLDDDVWLCLALGQRGELRARGGAVEGALEDLVEARDLARRLGNQPFAEVLTSSICVGMDDLAGAEEATVRAIALLQEEGHLRRETQQHLTLALIRMVGRSDPTSEIEEALEGAVTVGSRAGEASALSVRGTWAQLQGDGEGARQAYAEAMALIETLGEIDMMALQHVLQAIWHLEFGTPADARAELDAAGTIRLRSIQAHHAALVAILDGAAPAPLRKLDIEGRVLDRLLAHLATRG